MKVSKETSAKHRDELLNAASRLFRERGFDKVGIAEIAAAAGLTHGAFYTHFESKEALCAEVIALAAGRSRAAQDSRPNWRASVEAYLSPKHAREQSGGAVRPCRPSFDTNIVVYAFRAGCGEGREAASILGNQPTISVQVFSGHRAPSGALSDHSPAETRPCERAQANQSTSSVWVT